MAWNLVDILPDGTNESRAATFYLNKMMTGLVNTQEYFTIQEWDVFTCNTNVYTHLWFFVVLCTCLDRGSMWILKSPGIFILIIVEKEMNLEAEMKSNNLMQIKNNKL